MENEQLSFKEIEQIIKKNVIINTIEEPMEIHNPSFSEPIYIVKINNIGDLNIQKILKNFMDHPQIKSNSSLLSQAKPEDTEKIIKTFQDGDHYIFCTLNLKKQIQKFFGFGVHFGNTEQAGYLIPEARAKMLGPQIGFAMEERIFDKKKPILYFSVLKNNHPSIKMIEMLGATKILENNNSYKYQITSQEFYKNKNKILTQISYNLCLSQLCENNINSPRPKL